MLPLKMHFPSKIFPLLNLSLYIKAPCHVSSTFSILLFSCRSKCLWRMLPCINIEQRWAGWIFKMNAEPGSPRMCTESSFTPEPSAQHPLQFCLPATCKQLMCFHLCDYFLMPGSASHIHIWMCISPKEWPAPGRHRSGKLGKNEISLQKCCVWMSSRNEYLISLRSWLLKQSCCHSCPATLSTPGRGSTAVWV